MSLPIDLWPTVYQASTPTRRKAILALSTDISAAIRPSLTACVCTTPSTPLPSLTRFEHLSDVYEEITPAQLSEVWETVSFDSCSGTLRLHFKSLVSYKQGLAYRVLGASGISVRVPSMAAMRFARCLVSRCSGLKGATLTGETYMDCEWRVQMLANASLEDVAFEDLRMPLLNMPSLVTLRSVTPWNLSLDPQFFRCIPRLRDLIITANRFVTAFQIPDSLRFLHIFLQQPQIPLTLFNVVNLQELHLHNVVTTIQLPPCLSRLTLVNSRIGLEDREVLSHPPLQLFSFSLRNPSSLQYWAWKDQQATWGGEGWCRSDQICLTFHL